MTDESDGTYEAPCHAVLRSVVACENCGKRVTVHTLRYRHLCVPAVQRIRQATAEAHEAVQRRAANAVEEERSGKYTHLFSAAIQPSQAQ